MNGEQAPNLPMTRQALWDLSTTAAGIGTYVLHLPGQDLEIDDRLLELSALARDTFTGRPEDVYAHVHPEDVTDVIARVEHALATAGTYTAEYRIVLAEGGSRWVSARGQVLTDQAGTAVALVGAVHDVTEAREATARTATILETMVVGYLAIDTDWSITYVNAAAERVAQAPRTELVGRSFWEAFPATVGTEFERSYRRAVATGAPITFDAFYPEPLDVWVEVRAVPGPEGLALYFLDITERQRAQEAAQRSAVQVRALAEVALAMVDLDDVTDLVNVIAERGLAALGADGGAVAVHAPDQPSLLLSYVTASYGPGARADYARLPLEAALPVCEAARTGKRVLVGDRAACLDYSPAMADVVTSTGSQAFASLPLRAGNRVIAVLTAGWDSPQAFGAGQVELLEAFAAQCAQALQRLQSRDAERTSAQRQAGLVSAARSLAEAETEADVLAVVAAHGEALISSSVWGLALRSPDGASVRILGTEDIDADVRTRVSHLPADFALPVVHSATTGASHHLRDLAETAARFPAAHDLYTAVGLQASASVPLQVRGTLLGSLSVASLQVHTWSDDERDLLEAFAGLTAQTLARIAAHEAEQAALVRVSGIAETLQRSMLTAPPEPDHLQIAVRYAASAQAAEVGGDWYDSFVSSQGLTSLVIGDVTGHDMAAAAVMGQLRNLVRGIGFTLGEPPAAVLAAVDRAATGLGIDTVTTAILAQVEMDEAHRAAGTRLLRWSNAGHLPPLLIEADGTARYLEAEPDLVLGWDPHTERHDHEHVLEPGSTVLLYTDGLVERRGVSVGRGLEWLAGAVAELASSPQAPLEELCDALVALVGEHTDDDVALLALRAHPEDAPRPAEAGPSRLPARLEEALDAAEQDAQR